MVQKQLLRIAGRFIGKMRRMSNHFKSGFETMIREAEMEEMEKKWQEQNRKVMEQHPHVEMTAANNGGAAMVPLPPPEDKAGEAELAVQAEVEAEAASAALVPAAAPLAAAPVSARWSPPSGSLPLRASATCFGWRISPVWLPHELRSYVITDAISTSFSVGAHEGIAFLPFSTRLTC